MASASPSTTCTCRLHQHSLGDTGRSAQLLPIIKQAGLPYIVITTDETNHASQRVITANGGLLVETFLKPASQGNKPALRYHIALK